MKVFRLPKISSITEMLPKSVTPLHFRLNKVCIPFKDSSELECIEIPRVIPIDPETTPQPIIALPPNDYGELANLQFPKKIWYIVNNPYYHCMFWTGINCDPDEHAEIGHGDYRGSTSFVV